MKSIVDMYRATSQTVIANGSVAYSDVDVVSGNGLIANAELGTVTFRYPGVYRISFTANATTSSSTAVTGTLSIAQGTTAIGGGSCSATLTSGQTSLFVIDKVIKVLPSQTSSLLQLSVVNTGSAQVNVTSAQLNVERIA